MNNQTNELSPLQNNIKKIRLQNVIIKYFTAIYYF